MALHAGRPALAALFSDGTGQRRRRVIAVDSEAPEGVELVTCRLARTTAGRQRLPPGRPRRGHAWAGTARRHVRRHPAEAELDRAGPVVRLSGTGAGRGNGHIVDRGRAAQPRHVVVIDHSGTAEHTRDVEIVVGDGADLTVVSVQEWDDDAVHLAQHDAAHRPRRGLRHIVVTLGGDVVRVNTNVALLRARAAPSRRSASTSPTRASTRSTACSSTTRRRTASPTSTYKGALQGDSAHTVWVGDVLIRAAAEGTDTYELNRNLVLTDGARADSVPNLEIETGEIVGAGHASATGRFDDEQLFYLQARGIPEDERPSPRRARLLRRAHRTRSASPSCRSA